jgi:hypothetical protein
VNALADFLSQEAGQRRREWLDQQAAGVANALSYYLGPELSQSGGHVVNALAFMNPVQDVGDAMAAGRDGRYVDMLTNTASAVAPVIGGYAAKRVNPQMVDDAAQWLQDAVMGFSVNPTRTGLSDAGRNWLVDEYGGIRAYHGTPHDFDKFSMDKIGTGEGAQAYGHGLYFAENEAVARGYRDALAGKAIDGKDPVQNAWDMIYRLAPDDPVKAAAQREEIRQAFYEMSLDNDQYADFARRTVEAIDSGAVDRFKAPGRIYEVNINADPADFLDWDRPLSEQSAAVRSLAESAPLDMTKGPTKAKLRAFKSGTENPAMGIVATGQDLHRAISAYGDNGPAAAEALKASGIPGIKYLDAGSRGAGDGSRNFVVFDENLIEIVKKYGIAGAAAMLGVSAADVQSAMGGEQY